MKKKLSLFVPVLLLLLCCLTLRAEAAELTQLAAPTDLTWGREYWWGEDEYEEIPGMCSYKVNYPCQNRLHIALYSTADNEEISSYTINYDSEDILSYESEPIFLEGYYYDKFGSTTADCDFPSGTYYFTVQALGDGETYSDSEVVTSPTWTYTAPSAKLPTPTNLRWDRRTSRWDEPDNTDLLYGYIVDYYWKNPETNELESVGGTYGVIDSEDYLDDYCIENGGLGNYYFRLRATSMDVTQTTGSYWSELSPAYNLTEISSAIDSSLEHIYNNYDYLPEGETLDEYDAADMKDWLWDEADDIESLEAAMAADTKNDGTTAHIEKLENLVGGPANVDVAEDAPEGLEGNISIVGANLNTAGNATTTLKVGKADEGTVIPEQYHNTIQFSMALDGVDADPATYDHELKIPVKITMPVPASINPEFLVLLHFHADGTYEELTLPHIFVEGGTTWVSFVVTSFSDFAMAERGNGIGILKLDSECISAMITSKEEGSAVAALYGKNNQLLDSHLVPVNAGSGEVEFDLTGLAANTTVKIFLLDEDGSPLCQEFSKTLTAN